MSAFARYLLAGICLAVAARPLGASVVAYNNEAAWLAAAGAVDVIDFEGIAPTDGDALFLNPSGLTLSNVTFNDVADELWVFDANFLPPYTNWGSGADLITNAFNDTVTATLPAGGVLAVGADIFTVAPDGQHMLVGLSTTNTYLPATHANPNLTFVGFVSTTPITFITFEGIDSATGLDNFSFSAPSTPEPDTMFAGILGLAALAARRARIRFRPRP
jgi:hypothetical protein